MRKSRENWRRMVENQTAEIGKTQNELRWLAQEDMNGKSLPMSKLYRKLKVISIRS